MWFQKCLVCGLRRLCLQFATSSLNGFYLKLDNNGDVRWAQMLSGSSLNDRANGISVDKNGDVYLVGQQYLSDSTDTSSFAALITKPVFPGGASVGWTQKLSGLSDVFGLDIAVDEASNTYVTGQFAGTAAFGEIKFEGGITSRPTITSLGEDDAFVAKLDKNGNVVWANNFGGSSSDKGTGITVDETGNTYITGTFSDFITFGDITLTSNVKDSDNIFVAKLDNDGNVTWAESFNVNFVNLEPKITLDKESNIYITGAFSKTVNFGETTLTSKGWSNSFVLKLDNNGNVVKVNQFGSDLFDKGNDIAVDESGAINVTGEFQGTANFGDKALTSASSFADVFVTRIDSSDNLNSSISSDNTFKLNGDSALIQFRLKNAKTDTFKEVALFTVDDDEGTINGITPDDSNYSQAIIESARSIFSIPENPPNGFETNINSTLKIDSDSRFLPLLIEDGSLEELRNGTLPLSKLILPSPDSVQEVESFNDDDSIFELSFESNPQEAKFDDAIIEMQLSQEPEPIGIQWQDKGEGEVIDLRNFRSTTGKLNATFTVNREAKFDNIVGFYRVNEDGGIDIDGDANADFLPGEAGYAEAAVRNRINGIDLIAPNQGTEIFTSEFEVGSIFAPFIIVDGNYDAFVDDDFSNNPEIYFPYLSANSDNSDHIQMLGNNVFGFEDLPDGGDKDFNDIIVSVEFN
ncbi:MAG: SBBP repeat-containing protein [Cyanobacteria bacterium P01_C01_bin.38]